MLGEIQHLEQLVHFTRGNWDLALCRSPQTCFSCLNYVVHSIYVQSSTCSSHAGNFRINMFEPVSALLSIWSWHLWFSVTRAHHLSIPLQTPFILLLIHSTCYLVLYPIPLHVTHSHCFPSVITSRQALTIALLAIMGSLQCSPHLQSLHHGFVISR